MKRSNDYFLTFADLAFLLFTTVVAGYVFMSAKTQQGKTEEQKAAYLLDLAVPKLVAERGKSQPAEGVEVRVDQAGNIQLNRKPVEKLLLKSRLASTEAKSCILVTDPAAPAEPVLQVFVSLRDCGISDVQVVYQEIR